MERLSASSQKDYFVENGLILKERAKGCSALDQIWLVYEDDLESCGWMRTVVCDEEIWRD